MHIRIREARPGDFEILWRIDQQCFAPGISYSRAELAYYLGQRGAFTLVAETSAEESPPSRKGNGENRVVGFTVGQRQSRGVGHVITIDVLPGARRSGVGTMLMRATEERLRDQSCTSVFLETAVDNEPALKFYKRHGYFVVKTIPRYYEGKLDALLLAKQLK